MNKANDIIIYLCEKCGEIRKFKRVSTSYPNIQCSHDGYVNFMTMIWPRTADEILKHSIGTAPCSTFPITYPFGKTYIKKL